MVAWGDWAKLLAALRANKITAAGFMGGLLSVLAAWRYHVVNRDIERGKVSADRGLVILVTAMVMLLSGAMIVLVLLTAEQP